MLAIAERNIFQIVKHISTIEVAKRYMPSLQLRQRGNRWIARCPFHADKTPSFYIFQDNGWMCFGCQESGRDAADLVGRVLNIKPVEAARMIARDFGLQDTRPVSSDVRRQIQEIKRKRELEAAFKKWRDKTYAGLCVLYRSCGKIIADGTDNAGFAAACQIESRVEYLLDVLLRGTLEEQIEFFNGTEIKINEV